MSVLDNFKKKKYYDSTEIRKHNADYYMLLGGRSIGKSHEVKLKCLEEVWDDVKNNKEINHRFIILRRWSEDTKVTNLKSYWNDFVTVDKTHPKPIIETLTKGKYNNIHIRSNEIFLAKVDSKKGTVGVGPKIGYVMSLNLSERYKSGIYTDCTNLIYEEFITDKLYLADEPDTLQDLVSTIARNGKIKVWLIGNTISRLCPYFQTWCLSKIPKQKMGTIDDYLHDIEPDEDGTPRHIKISVEYCESNIGSEMAFGQRRGAISGGIWQSSYKPKLPKIKEKYDIMHRILFKAYEFKFMGELLCDKEDGSVFWYVYPKTTDNGITSTTRIISDKYETSNYFTFSLTPLTEKERIPINLLREGKIVYSDNLTGTEFENVLELYKRPH